MSDTRTDCPLLLVVSNYIVYYMSVVLIASDILCLVIVIATTKNDPTFDSRVELSVIEFFIHLVLIDASPESGTESGCWQ